MRSRSWCSALLLAALAAGCGSGRVAGFADRGVVNTTGAIRIHDVRYDGASRIEALLLVPKRGERHPGVVFLHGSGGSRLDLLLPAAQLALKGAVTMTITMPPAMSYDRLVEDTRRALDVLAARKDVDAHRLALVGYSLGAQVAAIVAGMDTRVVAAGIVAGRASSEDVKWIARTHAKLFFSAGINDGVVPPPQLQALMDAAPPGRRVRWYDTGHEMSRAVFSDQDRWLEQVLGLPSGRRSPGST